ILEVSADLSDRQRTRMEQLPPGLRDRVVWLDRLPETPIRGVMLANEVLDALPVQRFVVQGGRPYELGVGFADTGSSADLADPAALVWREAPDELAAATAMLRELPEPLPDGYVSELCPRVEPWLLSVGQCLGHGALLLFDYGLPRAHYYHPQRTDGTLRCYFKQRAHDDPFINIGVQDITAWVDFTRVGEAALAAGLEVAGFATQAAFLLGSGIEALVAEAADTVTSARLAGEARRLLLPGEMGESFKVMAVCRNLEQPLRGFAYQDLRTSL
ncbi:MAG TPA: SAM-dependent methyltransferase, partial [Steroidobacteraceae bacterium]|nr:SAM-dependent methyltransferase [Steroidobacteraceae bacterium]